MPDTEHKLALEKKAMQRLATALKVDVKELEVQGSDTGMSRVLTIERIAEIIEEQNKRRIAEAKTAKG